MAFANGARPNEDSRSMTDRPCEILVVGSEPEIASDLNELCAGRRMTISLETSRERALSRLGADQPAVVLLGAAGRMEESLFFVQQAKETAPGASLVLICDRTQVGMALEAVQLGVDDLIIKPVGREELDRMVAGLSGVDGKSGNGLRPEVQAAFLESSLVGASSEIAQVKRTVHKVADSELSVLITGESGTGKELVARALHALSSRVRGPLVKVNCAALPEELLEAELFGYQRGAFTSAYSTKPGRFEYAEKGTIFLDEIGELPVGVQSKLLQVLEHREFTRLGGKRSMKVDVRIVAATNRPLGQALSEGVMREDLLYRINEATVHVPRLGDRIEDITVLVEHFFRKYSLEFGKEVRTLSAGTMRSLLQHDWPGNVRELEAFIKKVIVFGDEDAALETLGMHHQSPASPGDPAREQQRSAESSLSLREISLEATRRAERPVILEALNRTRWNRRQAAKLLGISYGCLLNKIKRYEIE
jgi:DNA-binding NtrC family response regulator